MKILIPIMLFATVLISGCVNIACTEDARLCPDGSSVARVPPECEFAPCPGYETTVSNCESSGGTIKEKLFCNSLVSGFIEDCSGLIGPSGCSPENSHELEYCDCGELKCYNGTHCVIS